MENTIDPKIKVINGVVEFSTDVIALSISVSANANRKAGIKVPAKAESATHFHSSFFMDLMLLNPIVNKNIAANKVRIAPNCKGESPIRDFFIRINELPQTIDSIAR